MIVSKDKIKRVNINSQNLNKEKKPYIYQKSFESYKITVWQLLLYGVHIGHSFLNSILYAAWLVYSYRQNILFINIFKTIWTFRLGFRSLSCVSAIGGPVWFINMDQSMKHFVKQNALMCGEYYIVSNWINGYIGNYIHVACTILKLRAVSEYSWRARYKNCQDNIKNWFLTRYSWPRAALITSIASTYPPARECCFLGIPCLGISDTNALTITTNLPIPANDDSIDCVSFYNNLIANYIMMKKFNQLTLWYYNIRDNKRGMNFKNWYAEVYKNKMKKFLMVNENKILSALEFNYDYSRIKSFYWGMLFFVSKGYFLENYKEYYRIWGGNVIANLSKNVAKVYFKWFLSVKHDLLLRLTSFYRINQWSNSVLFPNWKFEDNWFQSSLLCNDFYDLYKSLIYYRYQTIDWGNIKAPFFRSYLTVNFFGLYNKYRKLSNKYSYKTFQNTFLYVLCRTIHPERHQRPSLLMTKKSTHSIYTNKGIRRTALNIRRKYNNWLRKRFKSWRLFRFNPFWNSYRSTEYSANNLECARAFAKASRYRRLDYKEYKRRYRVRKEPFYSYMLYKGDYYFGLLNYLKTFPMRRYLIKLFWIKINYINKYKENFNFLKRVFILGTWSSSILVNKQFWCYQKYNFFFFNWYRFSIKKMHKVYETNLITIFGISFILTTSLHFTYIFLISLNLLTETMFIKHMTYKYWPLFNLFKSKRMRKNKHILRFTPFEKHKGFGFLWE